MKYSKVETSVIEQGTRAYREGRGMLTCPYKKNSKQARRFRRLWLDGYLMAQSGTTLSEEEPKILIIRVNDAESINYD